MIQILEFRNKEKYCILKANLDMNDLFFGTKRIRTAMLAEDLGAKEVAITIKDDNEKYYFLGIYDYEKGNL